MVEKILLLESLYEQVSFHFHLICIEYMLKTTQLVSPFCDVTKGAETSHTTSQVVLAPPFETSSLMRSNKWKVQQNSFGCRAKYAVFFG